MKRLLFVDLETFSSTDLSDCGVYRYCESPDFRILLLGYAYDDEPVSVLDLTQETVPDGLRHDILHNPDVTKVAHNAAFEMTCLGRYYGRPLDPAEWEDTMLTAAACGLPMSLGGAGAALGLPEDKQKDAEGKRLLRFFSTPCEPTLATGMQPRHSPREAPEKWQKYIEYNRQDVVAERAIYKMLAAYRLSKDEQEAWQLDQAINRRGVRVDTKLAEAALKINTVHTDKLMAEMQKLTGLENPNSLPQLKKWLGISGALNKEMVAEMLENATGIQKRVLEIRRELGKSSVAKYEAIKRYLGGDGRVRGLFQFYGAGRTGRWCLTGDHEVLTPTGWIRLDEWHGGVIACWNKDTEVVSFQNAKPLRFAYSGEMYHYKDTRIDQVSTPDHKMAIKRNLRYQCGPWETETVQNMVKHRPLIPISGNRIHSGRAKDDLRLRILIMTQADGHYTDDRQLLFHFKKVRKVERCKRLLRRAEIVYSTSVEKNGSVTFRIAVRHQPIWLRMFRDKVFDFWLLDEDPEVIFDELPNWDGYRITPNSLQYSTCVKQNADLIQALAHVSGRTATILKKEHPNNPERSTAYLVNIWENAPSYHELKVKPQRTDFDGFVYCAETTTGFFLVRRKGRCWITGNSGRGPQLQNLPQNHIDDLSAARETALAGDEELLDTLYGNVPDTLSQLIRTTFIPKAGCTFAVADFSAIEARVIAYLADEQWRVDLFAKGGDIYCQSASQMFHVPVEKHGVNGHLRQKGKIAELACIAQGSKVLTNHGLKRIEKVTPADMVFDGEHFVQHSGVIFRGYKRVMYYEGLNATPDHIVYLDPTQPVFGSVEFQNAKASDLHLWHPHSYRSMAVDMREGIDYMIATYDILNCGPWNRYTVSNCVVHNCGYGGSVGALKNFGALKMGLKEEELQPIVDAWREASPNIVQFWYDVGDAVMNAVKYGEETHLKHGLRVYRTKKLLCIQLPSGRTIRYFDPRITENKFGKPSVSYMATEQKQWVRVESYGPKFVENIVQALSRDCLMVAMKRVAAIYPDIVMHIHDEMVVEVPVEDAERALKRVCFEMGRPIPWAPGLLLRGDGYITPFYRKD